MALDGAGLTASVPAALCLLLHDRRVTHATAARRSTHRRLHPPRVPRCVRPRARRAVRCAARRRHRGGRDRCAPLPGRRGDSGRSDCAGGARRHPARVGRRRARRHGAHRGAGLHRQPRARPDDHASAAPGGELPAAGHHDDPRVAAQRRPAVAPGRVPGVARDGAQCRLLRRPYLDAQAGARHGRPGADTG